MKKKYIDSFNERSNKEYVDIFNSIFKTIKKYIDYTLKSEEKIDKYVPNTHIAEVFRDVLSACEMESMYPDVFHNLEHDPYDSVPNERKHLYVFKDGKYYLKETYRISFIDVIDEYFDLKKLKENGIDEIYSVYQKLREKKDPIRNNLKLCSIVIPLECWGIHKAKNDLRTDKIKIK